MWIILKITTKNIRLYVYELQKTWDKYHVFVKEKKAVDIVYHSYMVALIDKKGFVRYRYVGLVDPEEVIVKDVEYLLDETTGTN